MVVPYSKANGPPAFSEMLPPRDDPALEAGSTVKSSPFLAAAWMAFKVITPDWAVMVRSSGSMSRMVLNRESDRITQRASAGMAPPVAPVPPPRGMIPKCIWLASLTITLDLGFVLGEEHEHGQFHAQVGGVRGRLDARVRLVADAVLGHEFLEARDDLVAEGQFVVVPLPEQFDCPLVRMVANSRSSMGRDMFSRRSTAVLTSSGSMNGL